MSSLNPAQRNAVTHIESPLLVLAGAGSGKTRVITEKIKWLIAQAHYAPDQIAAITFTNKAAKEMRERLGRQANEVVVSTFHSLGWQILKNHPDLIGRRRGLSILDQYSAFDLIKELLPSNAPNDMIWAVQAGIGRYKDGGHNVTSAREAATDEASAQSAEIYQRYDERLKALNAVDFDDLISLPLVLLKDPQIRAQWQQKIQYLLVDEYQDTSQAQYQLMQALVGERPGLTAVGDDDQSIYGWRGARPDNLSHLERDYRTLRVIKLEQNYRSAGNILTSANHLIAHNPHAFEKKLWSDLGPGERVCVMSYSTDQDEAESVAREVFNAHHAHQTKWGQCAILYRSNQQARPMELALREMGIPYLVSGGPSWFDAREIRDGLSYLRLILNPADNPAFMRVANAPRRGLGSVAMAALGRFSDQHRLSFFESAMHDQFHQEIQPKAAQAFRGFTNLLVDFNDQIERHGLQSLGSVFAELIEHIDYLDWVASNDDPKQKDRRRKNLKDLCGWLTRLGQEDLSPDALLARLALVAGPDDDRHDGVDQVRLMTLHAAKGLEFDRVWLVGCEEGLLPHKRSVEEGQLEEERRLMYVGITRARRVLNLSYCQQRKRLGEVISPEPSRFLEELPEACIDWPHQKGREPTTGEAAKANIAALKALLED